MLTLERQETAKVIGNSLCPENNRILTVTAEVDVTTLLKLLSQDEFYVTVIPKSFTETIEQVKNNPFVPIHWRKARYSKSEKKYHDIEDVLRLHLPVHGKALKNAIFMASELHEAGNTTDAYPLLAPFVRYNVLFTATVWENFFEKYCPQYFCDIDSQKYRSRNDFLKAVENTKDTEVQRIFSPPIFLEFLELNQNEENLNMQLLAETIWDQYSSLLPKRLKPGQWHSPFADKQKKDPLFSYHFAKVLTVADHNKESLLRYNRYNKYKGFLPATLIPEEAILV